MHQSLIKQPISCCNEHVGLQKMFQACRSFRTFAPPDSGNEPAPELHPKLFCSIFIIYYWSCIIIWTINLYASYCECAYVPACLPVCVCVRGHLPFLCISSVYQSGIQVRVLMRGFSEDGGVEDYLHDHNLIPINCTASNTLRNLCRCQDKRYTSGCNNTQEKLSLLQHAGYKSTIWLSVIRPRDEEIEKHITLQAFR